MAEKQESRIGMSADGKLLFVFCGGKIGVQVGGSRDKQAPYVCVDIGELEEKVEIGSNTSNVPFKWDGGTIRIVAYESESLDVFIRAFESAKKMMNDILEYNKKVDDL